MVEVKQMSKKMTREDRKTTFLKEAAQLFDKMETWYEHNPEATFEELEAQLRPQRRALMGEGIKLWVNGGNESQTTEMHCPHCGRKMRYKGRVSKTIIGLEGDTTLDRAYYVCPNQCEGTAFFPTGQEAETAA